MKRWNATISADVETPAIDAFLAEIIGVCKKHGLSISHEDTHGGFIVAPFSDGLTEWLMAASDETDTRSVKQFCSARPTGISVCLCTEPRGHVSDHICRTARGEIIATWPQEEE